MHLPYLQHTDLQIDSANTFPHSSGIASSASAMGALAMCLVTIEESITGSADPESVLQKASFIARLGSGSASRSVFPSFALWGATDSWTGSSNEYAIPVIDYHENFKGMRDSILLVESGQKKISSTAGHSLMETNPYSASRFRQAFRNMATIKPILAGGDWGGMIDLMEEEALSLHAMMMTSRPGYMLMQPETVAILDKVRIFRNDTGLYVGFTMDAGANVHLLFAAEHEQPVREFIESELIRFCEDRQVLHDRMGIGPQKLNP
jgi:diphosphomevalonate decarboxylase